MPNNGNAIDLDGSTQYLSATTPSSGTYPALGYVESGANIEGRFRNLRLSHGSDQTLFEMTGFGRLMIPSGTTTLRWIGRDGSNAEVTLGSLVDIVFRCGTSMGPYVSGPENYLEVWNERLDDSSHLSSRVSAVNNTGPNLSSTAFALGARIGGTEKARVQIGFFRFGRAVWTEYLNYPSYWTTWGIYLPTYGHWFFENTLDSSTTAGGMTLTLTNNGAAGYVATPNVAPYANAGPDQPGASAGRFLLDGSGSYDVDNSVNQAYQPASWSWTQLTGSALTILHPTAESTFVDGGVAGNTYTFRLTVTDEKGDTATDDVSVTCVAPSAAIAVSNSTPYVGQVVQITSTSVGYADFLQSTGLPHVDIDDGAGNGTASISYMPETATAYLTPGIKTITQNIRSYSGSATQATTNVTVSALPTSFSNTYNPTTAAELQTAIDNAAAASGHQLIQLPANTNINVSSSIVLKEKIDSSLIWIRTTAYSSLPSLSNRINPTTQQALLATLTMTGVEHPIFTTDDNQPVANYYISGIDFYAGTNQQTGGIVLLGNRQVSTADEPRNIVLAHCVVRGPVSTTVFTRHGVFLNCRDTSVIGCYIDEIHDNTSESHGIAILNTTGGLFIWNNFIAATGENILGGGSAITMPEVTPSRMTIRRNHLYKHLKWQSTSWGGSGGVSDGSLWTIKNNLEFKTAKYTVCDANIYENCWVQGDQVGYAVNLNNIGDDPWADYAWIQVTNGWMKNTGTGHTLRGRDEKIWKGKASVMKHLLVRNNFYNPIGDILLWIPAGGYIANLLRGILDFGYVHNTSDETGPVHLGLSAEKFYSPMFLNNMAPHNTYGYKGDGVNPGTDTFSTYTVNMDFRGQLLAGADPAFYPAGGSGLNANHYPLAADYDDQFVNYAGLNFRIANTSVAKNGATDGTDIGCNFDQLDAALLHVVDGQWDSGGTGAQPAVKLIALCL